MRNGTLLHASLKSLYKYRPLQIHRHDLQKCDICYIYRKSSCLTSIQLNKLRPGNSASSCGFSTRR
ncbi:Uncharacterised protein [Chromobacterium vaccinii]|nr:Uncharacterised protein [Chromobacterium vaccinii]